MRSSFLPSAAALAVFLLLPAPPAAAGLTPITVKVQAVAESPFEITVQSANLVDQGDGTRALKIEYKVRNLTAIALGTQGWMLTIESNNGKRQVLEAFSIDLGGGQTKGHTVTLAESTIGKLAAGDRVLIAAHTAGYGRCRGRDQSCRAAEAACHAYCNNPLGGPHEVQRQSCGNCRTEYDMVEKCTYTRCDVVCECEPSPWPDERGFLPWGEF